MNIFQLTESSQTILNEINRLLPQLSPSAKLLSEKELLIILNSKTNHILLAQDQENICGMLTLVTYFIPTGKKALIEDVVVDKAWRGKGIGRMLIEKAIALAKNQEVKCIDLTSNPARVAANALYIKAGFVKRETNVYRYHLA